MSNFKEPFAIVLTGLPASGKSTWLKKVFDAEKRSSLEREVVVVSSDNWIEHKATELGITYSEAFDKHIGWATRQMKMDATNAIKAEKNIVWDQTNLSSKKRKSILSQLPDRYLKVAVVFDIDDRELERRLEERAESSGKSIPDHVMENMLSSYRPVTKEEGFGIIIKVR